MMMKRIFTNQFLCAVLFVSFSAQAQDSLFISEVTDPADDYSGRFIELYNAGSEIIDFSTTTCYLSRQSNGGTSWGDLQLSGTVAAGSAFVIGGSGFEALYGKAPDQVSGILIGNGDDAYALFTAGDHETGVLHDILGIIDMDGTGELWEYEDSRALRIVDVLIPNTTWTASEWEIASANYADCDPGTHHGSVPIDTISPGSFTMTIINDTVDRGQAVELMVAVSELTMEDNIISYQFDIDFDTTVLEFTGITVEGTLAEGGTAVVNSGIPGKLSVGYMNATALMGAGGILMLQFNSLLPDTTDLLLSNAYLNTIAVQDLIHGTVIIVESAPPSAVISYSDSVNRFADTLVISATFSEAMAAANPVRINLSGAVNLAEADMIRLSETVYTYLYQIPNADGDVNLTLSNGTDLWGNDVVPVPTAGGTFTITGFMRGDVNDDGVIQAYDAALALQYSVGIDPLPDVDPMPWEPWRDSTANVDGSSGITANDAGMILQYSAGIISSFSSGQMKSASLAYVTLALVENHIVFYSHGELLGLNINTTNEDGILGTPEVLKEEFMWAINMDGTTYRIGLCTASSASDGDAVMKIPFNGSGAVTFHIIENTDERMVTVDLLTGVFVSELNQIEIYPNPVVDILLISGLSGPLVAQIYNIQGQLLFTAHTEGNSGEVDVSDLPGGLYMIMFESGKETVIRKFLKR
jgi:hypothetical protein